MENKNLVNLFPYECKIISNKHHVECLENKESGFFNANISLDIKGKIMSINIISELIPHHSMCEWNIKRNTVHKCECEYAIYLYDNAINEEMITNILTEILYIQYTINAEYIHEKYSSKVIHISMAALYAHIQSKINKPLSDIIIKLPIPIKCDR